MRCSPLLYFGISAIFQECYAMMPGFHGDSKMIKEHLMQGKFLQTFPGQTCELIPNIGLPYPEYHHAGDSRYETKLISLNSYVCADMKFAEPYYKTEAVHSYDKIDHHIFDPKKEPGVERSFGIHDNGFILSRAKYYDRKKKPFNIYTGKYLKPSKGDGILKPPRGHSKRKSSKPKQKVTFKHSDRSKASRDDSGSISQAKHKAPINNAKMDSRKASDSESVEKTDRDRSISKSDNGEVVQEANKPLMLGNQVLGAASGGALAGGRKNLEKGEDGVNSRGKDMVEGAEKHGNDMVEGAKEHGNDMVEGAKKLGNDMAKGAKKHGNDMVEKGKKHGKYMVEGAKKHGNDIVKKGKKRGNDMVEGAKKHGNDIVKKGKKHGNDMVEGAKKHGNDIVKKGKKHGNDMLEDAKERGKGVLKDARDRGKSVVDKGTSHAKRIMEDVKSRGEDLVEKGKSGAKSAGKAVVDKLPGVEKKKRKRKKEND